MNLTHIHLLLNHFPILGTLIGSLILLYGTITKQEQSKSIAFVILVLMALIAIPVYLTGEPAEETVKHLIGVSKSTIHEHEEAAEVAIWVMELTGLLSLVALYLQFQKKSIARGISLITLLIALVSFGFMARVGYLGGQIRHTELSPNFNENTTANPNQTQGERDHKNDED